MKKIIGIFIMMLMIGTTLHAIGTINKCNTPNDPDFSKQWYLHNTGQSGGTIDADIDAPEAWGIETGNPDIIIAMIDSGIDYTHPDLADNIWINEDEIPDNSIDDDDNGYVDDVRGWDWYNDDNDPLDDLGHGTSCAGVLGAVGNNGIGITGICWNCKIMPLKYFGAPFPPEFNIDYLASAIRYAADNGANVISISIENIYENKPNLKDAVDYAYGKGVVLVHPAGNADTSDESYPGAYENVIAVGGTDHNDYRMNYYDDHYPAWIRSNYGPWVDVAAPGELVYTTTPTYYVPLNDFGFKQNYDYGTGTSASGPIVAGVAALLLSQDPSLTNDEIIKIIRANVDPYNTITMYLGTGRINAYKALTRYNTQPDKPVIDGPANGKPENEYTFTASCIDPDGDDLFYMWNWGDGNFSEWIETNEASYIWTTEDNFSISVMAKDIHGATSDWSDPLEFSIPKSKVINPCILRLIQRFPILELLL